MEKRYFKKDDLKVLIESLSLAEKRHFFQYVKSLSHQATPYYLELFKALSTSESQVDQLPEMTSKKAFSNAKIRLYQHLMQSLRNYHEGSSTELYIQNLICEIEILYDRGLPEQSLTLLKKAQRSASEQENFGMLLQFLTWERKLNIILDVPTRSNQAILSEEQKIFDQYEEINKLEHIYSKVMEIKKKHGYVKGAARRDLERAILKNPKLESKGKLVSKRGVYYYNFILSLYYWLTLDHKQAYLFSSELLATELQHISPNEYLEGVLQHTTSCMGLGYFEETLKGLVLAEAFVSQKRFQHSTFFLLRMFYFRICYKMIVYIYMGNIQGLRDTIKEANVQIAKFSQQLSIEMKLVIYGNLRNACIAVEDFEQAESLLDMLLYKESRHVRKDVYNDLFLSRIFSHLATKEYSLVATAAAAAYRQFKLIEKEHNKYDAGLSIASILMKDCDFENPKTMFTVLSDIKSILHESIISYAGLNMFHEIYTFYLIWTESLLNKQPFCSAASTWYKQYVHILDAEK
jgi:hypothetical protein